MTALSEAPQPLAICEVAAGVDLGLIPPDAAGIVAQERVALVPLVSQVSAPEEAALPAPAPGSVLDQLREAAIVQLEDRGFSFDLLLPVADRSLDERAEALFSWCRGFLGAFGLAAGAAPPLSEEGSEALQDLARLAKASAESSEDEEDEDALAELEEFVRVAALLLHGDCVLGPRHRRSLN